LLALLALAGYGVFLGINSTTAAGGSDSSGYLNSARLLASGHFDGRLRVPAEFGPQSEINAGFFEPFGFFATPDGALRPTYSPGLPLHFAAASKLVGWHFGTLFTDLGCALAALWLCYLIARELGLNPALAAAGATALGACPVFIFTSVQPLSDTPATTWVLAPILAALLARRRAAWAVACGAAFSMAVMMRPTNSVLLPAVLFLLGLDWRRLALLVLGGLPGAAWLGYYNHALYGSAFRSGYSHIGIETAFNLAYVPAALADFVRWFAVLLPAAFLVLPLALPFVRAFRNRLLVALALWFGAPVFLFACFIHSHETWWSLRYLLPAMPAFILAALLGLEALSRRFPGSQRPVLLNAAAVVLLLWAGAGSFYQTRHLGVLYTKGYEDVYADLATAAHRQFPPGSLVLSACFSGSIYAYTDFPMLRCDHLEPPEFARFAALAAKAGRPVCAVIFDSEEKDSLRTRCPGEWTRVGTVKNAGLWRLTGPLPTPAPAR